MISSLFLLFFKSWVIGFLLALPVGPIGILCIRRTLAGHYGNSLVMGAGAAAADAVYGAIAGFSLAGMGALIQQYGVYLHIFGGIFVGWLGFCMVRAPLPADSSQNREKESLFRGFTSAFLLTLSNPLTLIVFAAAFSTMGMVLREDSLLQGLVLTGGVFLGAMGWWSVLTLCVHILRHHLSESPLLLINRFSGFCLLGFSVYILFDLLSVVRCDGV